MDDNIRIVQVSKEDYQQEVEVQPTPKKKSPPEYVMLGGNKHGSTIQDTMNDILGTNGSEEVKTHMAAICIFAASAICLTIFIFYFLRWW